jgi:hypothetical protein
MRSTLRLVALCVPLVACGAKTLDISVEQRGCEGLSEDDNPESALVQTKEGKNYVFYRDWVFVSSTAEFDPEFGQERDEIDVREYWTDDSEGEGVDTCFRPTIVVNNPDPGSFTLFWFVGGDSTPFDNMQVEVD